MFSKHFFKWFNLAIEQNLVDLAGSERLADNGGTEGLQTGETGHINKSLFLLCNVIKKLADGKT